MAGSPLRADRVVVSEDRRARLNGGGKPPGVSVSGAGASGAVGGASGARGSTDGGEAGEGGGNSGAKSPPAALSQMVTEIVSPTAIFSSGGLAFCSNRA